MGACCGCGKTGPYKQITEHVTFECRAWHERNRDDPDDPCLDPAREWERLQGEEAEPEPEVLRHAPVPARQGANGVATPAVAEPIPDAKVIVLDKRGEAQRESDEIRAGFDIWSRIAAFVRKERYRDLGYATAAAWWTGERIAACSEAAEADRESLVRALRGAGLSVRATGALLEISPATVSRALTGKTGNEGRKSVSSSGKPPGQAAQMTKHAVPQTASKTTIADPFAGLEEDGQEPQAENQIQDHVCVCPACGNEHRKESS
jgi:predicted transcriptional regulator